VSPVSHAAVVLFAGELARVVVVLSTSELARNSRQ
jgi:hypothetical protein